ncbi:hypothetical protein [Oceanobacillus alkalisoli]|uniref:hypothetical protein n=1 Tax=Oceanobacillus alkalisoli TaxID=2925113 RepID=UPI001EF03B65|nr:hypothetical protein [Oceanobacillus alkalisoli]MCF3943124.1 hypothetical protein [Oceanobacillus alkalisoli]MCG5104708.1 hypothetical protein [Oceanobacillus alkalisoli]
MITISSNVENVGTSIEDEVILTSVRNGDSISEESGDFLTSYLPMYDPIQQEVIGMIGIDQDMSIIHDINAQIAWIVWAITVVTLLIVLFVAIRFSGSISRPIKYITQSMERLSIGNLAEPVQASNRRWGE